MVAGPTGGLWLLLRAIAAGDERAVLRLLESDPRLAAQPSLVGATRQSATSYYLGSIGHYVYAGDTALHVAAAAYHTGIARALVARGANARARDRRGAEPLHAAAAGSPGSENWNPRAQAAMIRYLIGAGADPNDPNDSGVTPLHVAVRTRCAAAVRELLARGADPRGKNGSGSTPLHLAVRTTGRGGSGTTAARDQQAAIIRLLIEHGARTTDTDGRGRSVAALQRSRAPRVAT